MPCGVQRGAAPTRGHPRGRAQDVKNHLDLHCRFGFSILKNADLHCHLGFSDLKNAKLHCHLGFSDSKNAKLHCHSGFPDLLPENYSVVRALHIGMGKKLQCRLRHPHRADLFISS